MEATITSLNEFAREADVTEVWKISRAHESRFDENFNSPVY